MISWLPWRDQSATFGRLKARMKIKYHEQFETIIALELEVRSSLVSLSSADGAVELIQAAQVHRSPAPGTPLHPSTTD